MNVSIKLKVLKEAGKKIAYVVLNNGKRSQNLEAFMGDDENKLLDKARSAAKKYSKNLYT